MTEQEWLAHLDAFVAQELTAESVRDVLDATVRRVNTIIIGYVNREHDDVQGLARQLSTLRNDLRALVEGTREREAGGDGDV